MADVEFDYDENEDRPMTDPDNGLVLQLRKMLKKSLKENTKLSKKLHEQTLFLENIRAVIIGLSRKVDVTMYPCEYNDAILDVIDLIDKLEWRKTRMKNKSHRKARNDK